MFVGKGATWISVLLMERKRESRLKPGLLRRGCDDLTTSLQALYAELIDLMGQLMA